MSDPLTDAANAISGSSPNVKRFAQLAAARIIELEQDVHGPSPTWSVAAPGSTGAAVTTLTNQVLPVNVYKAPANLADYSIRGSSDSAVLCQIPAKGSTFRRFNIDPCCNLTWTNPYARHGFYMDALNLLADDFYVRTPGGVQVGQAFSIRFAGAQVRRFDVAGFPFAVGFFQETDDRTAGGHVTAGFVLVEQGRAAFTHPDTGIWLDVDTAPKVVQAFTFRDLALTGAAGARFVAVNHATWAGTVTVTGCTLNGRKVTAADCDVPSRLTVA